MEYCSEKGLMVSAGPTLGGPKLCKGAPISPFIKKKKNDKLDFYLFHFFNFS